MSKNLILLIGFILFLSCDKEKIPVDPESDKKIQNFSFKKQYNNFLSEDYDATIEHPTKDQKGSIEVTLPTGTNINALKASFTISLETTLKKNGQDQVSNVTVNDFTNPFDYVLENKNGNTLTIFKYTIDNILFLRYK